MTEMMHIPDHVDGVAFRSVLAAYTTAYRSLGREPSVREVWNYWPQITEAAVGEMLALPDMVTALAGRGIVVDTPGLSHLQHLAIMALMDPFDRRSVKAKLEAVGATTQMYSSWMKSPVFQAARRAQAAKMWEDGLDDLKVTMLQQAGNGSFQHQQYILDTLGEGPKGRENENAREVVGSMIAAIQKATVGHPEIRQAILDEMTSVRMAVMAQRQLDG